MSKLHSLCVLFAFMALFSTRLNAQCTAQATGVAPSACGNCDGSASVVGAGGTAPYSYQWSTGDTTATIGTAFGGAPLCINTGGAQLLASNGNTFTDDQYFNGGTSFSNAIAIANTNDDALFQDERFVGNGGFFSYNIPVTNGNHLVELYFAEIFFGTSPTRPGGVGSRLFDVTIEGVLVLDDYDIFLDAGGPAIAIIKSFNVNVTDGTLNILFDGVVNNAKINALCVTPVSSTGSLCSGTYAVTVTDAMGCTATTDVTLAPGSCNDNNSCTTDTCSNDQCVFTAIICDDGDACTADSCLNGTCTFTAIPGCGDPCSGVTCDDGNACTNDACDNGNCAYTPIVCDDGDACTTDACNNGNCEFASIPGCANPCDTLVCNDGDACTTDACANGLCTYTFLNCDDNDLCTTDTCLTGQCSNTPADCDDGDACTADACNGGNCLNTPINCNDHNNCTTDACANGQCSNTPISCDDGDACTTDACTNGNCSNTSLDCNDNNACTSDSCTGGTCLNTPIPGCSDPCLSLNCDDNNACTADGCANGACTHTSACDDNDACTMETCHHDDDDDDGGDGYHCHYRNVRCDDHNKCTDDECVNGVCVYTPKVCSDNDLCTDDSCYRGHCKFTRVYCGDNDACTFDSCGAGICFNIERNCEEGNLCTVDFCVPHSHHINEDRWWDYNHRYRHTTCVHQPINCQDGDLCTDDECNAGNCTNTVIPDCCLTDADCDDSDPCTNDDCRNRSCRNTSDVLEIDERQSSCQKTTVTLEPSEAGDSYLWSTGETTFTIEGTPGAVYSVTVTFTSGCIKTASISVSNGAELLTSYVILAEKEVKMYKNTVFSGGVGVTDNNGKVRLKNQTKITAPGTFVQADHVQLSSGSQVTTINPDPANVDLPVFETNPYCNWSSNNVNVGQNQNITLSGSVYNNISVNRGATVTFTSSSVHIKSLYLKDNVTVNFANCSRVKICKWLRLGADNTFNPGQSDVVVFVEDEVEIGAGSTVFADIYLRDGWFTVKASAANDPTRLTGLFIAERFDAEDNALWYADTSCNSICAPSFQQRLVAKVAEESPEEAGVESSFTMDDITNGVHLKSYPNPFADKLNIEFMLDTDTRARLEVYNLTGQLVATLFDGNVTGGAIQRFEFTPQTNAGGIYIYRLQTATETFVGKAMMTR